MLTRLRARAVDGVTILVRLLDARRERDRLRETVECVCDERDEARRERDEYARLVATREVEIDELLRLRHEVERLAAERDAASLERDAHRDDISDLATRLNAACIELDARIPTDIDGAQEWAERHGVRFESAPPWRSYTDASGWPEVGSREWAVAGGVASALRSRYARDMQAGGDA